MNAENNSYPYPWMNSSQKGFYGTSTRSICRKAGISSGLLFHYFPNKERIYLELVKIGVEEMYIDTARAMQTPKEYLSQTLQGIFAQFENNPFLQKDVRFYRQRTAR